YGVVANYDDEKMEWIIDETATKKRREEIKLERKEKSMTFEEFWEYERKKLIENNLYEAVRSMYRESLELSEKWAEEFLEFWKLPNDFKFKDEVDENE
ncbi:MAG: hydantoinase B/oxoprolinase family protein, partial [Promethearchaeota archaeon]